MNPIGIRRNPQGFSRMHFLTQTEIPWESLCEVKCEKCIPWDPSRVWFPPSQGGNHTLEGLQGMHFSHFVGFLWDPLEFLRIPCIQGIQGIQRNFNEFEGCLGIHMEFIGIPLDSLLFSTSQGTPGTFPRRPEKS